jgi:DNA (cytosine-5)-methyltransferase 1
MITQSVAIPIQDGREMEKKQNGMGIAQEGDPAYTIDTTGAQAIAIQGTIIGRSENAGPQGVGATEGGPMFTLTKADIHGVATAMAVRRLTPRECERLQGFPDNWSRISWKGKPEDQCPDGPRYKACGNSMAVPVMRWIGERIAAVNSKL